LGSELATGAAGPPSAAGATAIDRQDRFAGARVWAARRPPAEMAGLTGRVVWSRYGGDPVTQGYTAATVHGYLVRHDKTVRDRWTLVRAIVSDIDAFNLRQRPLFFVAPFGAGRPAAWIWLLERYILHAPTLTADLVFVPRSRTRQICGIGL